VSDRLKPVQAVAEIVRELTDGAEALLQRWVPAPAQAPRTTAGPPPGATNGLRPSTQGAPQRAASAWYAARGMMRSAPPAGSRLTATTPK
jgi:hypothetical protein